MAQKSSMYEELSKKEETPLPAAASKTSTDSSSAPGGFGHRDSGGTLVIGKPKRPGRKAPELPLIESQNWLIHSHFVRSELDSCRSLVEAQLSASSNGNEYALNMKAVLAQQEGRISEARELFQECAKLNPRNTRYFKQIARCLVLLGRYRSAIDIYNEALKINAEDAELHRWKAICAYHSGDNPGAKDSLKQALTFNKHDEAAYELFGRIFCQEGNYAGAIDIYKRALEVSQENPDLLTTIGLLYMKVGSYQLAFEALGRALGFNPSHSGAILAAGSMMQLHGDTDAALSKYRLAAVEWPDSAQLWNNIGMCFHGKKKFVAAISCLKRAAYLAPFDWKILANLGNVHLGMQQYASAFNFLSAAINIQPNNASLYGALALALSALGDEGNTSAAHEKAISSDGTDPTLPLNYAIFLHRAGAAVNLERCKALFEMYEHRLAQAKESAGKGGASNVLLDQDMIDTANQLHMALSLIEQKTDG